MELKPEDYFIKNINNGECFICILPDGSDYEMILLGNSFLKGYYSTHDLLTNKFGFAAHATSTKPDPTPGPVPEYQLIKGLKKEAPREKKFIYYIIAAVLLVGCSLAVYFLVKRKK